MNEIGKFEVFTLDSLRISQILLEWRAATPAGKVCPGVTTQRACERGGTRTTRGKRPHVTEIDRISVFKYSCFASDFLNDFNETSVEK